MKVNNKQLAKIHIAKKQLGLTEDEYRTILKGAHVESAKDLSSAAAEWLLSAFRNMGWTSSKPGSNNTPNSVKNYGFGKNKYESLRERGKPYAVPQKLRRIEALWRDAARIKTDEALQSFIKNRTGINHITFLHDRHAKQIITALEAMKRAGEKNAVS